MQLIRSAVDVVYRNAKLATALATAGFVAIGAYFHPLPITRNWGDIAARDMAAKAEVAQDTKRKVVGYGSDGKWDAAELFYIASETSPRRFIFHRIKDMQPFGGRLAAVMPSYFDSMHPKEALEDALKLGYEEMFANELASYAKARQALFRDLYGLFVNINGVSYEEWAKAHPLDSPRIYNLERKRGEGAEEWALRHFQGSVDLTKTQADEQLYTELGGLRHFFSSPENQKALVRKAGNMGDSHDRMWNAIVLGAAALAGAALMPDRRKKKPE